MLRTIEGYQGTSQTRLAMKLAGLTDADALELKVQELADLPQAPVWSVSTFRGVYSKMDVMFATRALVTSAMLERFFEQAKVVLEEDDPKLDLPGDKRWAAAIYNKSRGYSTSLRDGVAESQADRPMALLRQRRILAIWMA